jgi:hypothetical protein
VELSGDFLFAGMATLVSSLPNLASYIELGECPAKWVTEFASACSGKPIANTLKTLRFPHGFAEDYDGDSDTAAQAIFQIFRNLNHLEIRFSGIKLSDIETVTALSRLTNLETLDFQGNYIFSGGDEDRVDEWLRTCLPLLPKSLKVIDLACFIATPISLISAVALKRRPVRSFRGY